jgi:teichuronic acid biosynthesis glycosyltransferase TuaC
MKAFTPQNPRILLATNMYPTPGLPWLGIFVWEQFESLKSLGLEIELSIHLGRVSRWNYLRGLREMIRQLKNNRFDLIHSHHTYSTLLAVIARRFTGCSVPIIQTFHEGEIFRRNKNCGNNVFERLKYSSGFKRWVLKHCDYLIPVNPAMLPSVFGQDCADQCPPCSVIPAGVDMNKFCPRDRWESRRKLDWAENDIYVFYPYLPGTAGKRYDLARSAFERFSRERRHTHLITGGDFDHELIPDVIGASNVVLALSDFEASPTIVKEALACETPVVSTDVGDTRKNYADLDGVLISDWEAGDAAEKLEQSISINSPFGGRECLLKLELNLPQVAERINLIYRKILKNENTTAE